VTFERDLMKQAERFKKKPIAANGATAKSPGAEVTQGLGDPSAVVPRPRRS
jgi:hypothetical protein